jgi:pyruvate formate lyase activating enzyme
VEACPTGALARVGEEVTASDTLARVAADEAFYRNSGGGVTFSGGEPFLQPEFLEALLLGCRARGIHTAVQTCGAVPAARLLELEPLIDLFLYDVKVMDPIEHRRCTGASNELILENLGLLAARARGRVGLRVPLVPGCTDAEENLSAIARLAVRLGIPGVELMPYHELGRDKHENLGRAYELASASPPASERAGRAGIEAAVRLFAGKGLACEIGGE